MRSTLSSFAIVVAFLATATTARADTGAVVVVGKAPPHAREVIATAIADAVRAASWTLSDAPFSPTERDAIAACAANDRPWACVEPTTRDHNVQRLVLVQVDAETAGRLVVTAQILIAGDAVPPTDRKWCDHCKDKALAKSATDLVRGLLVRGSVATLDVRTTPPSAAITLDGHLIGPSNRSISTAPGHHTLLVELSGYQSAERSVDVAEGTTLPVEIPLTPVAKTPPPSPTPTTVSPSTPLPSTPPPSMPPPLVPPPPAEGVHVLPIALMGGGSVALVGGLVYSLSTNPPATHDQPKYLYSGPGIGIAVAGGIAAVAGVYLWRHQRNRTSTPTAMVVPNGAAVGWAGSF